MPAMVLKSMPDILPKLMRGVASQLPDGKKSGGLGLAQLLQDWEKIVGADYADKTLPTALKWRKTSKTELAKDPTLPETKAILHLVGPAGLMLELKHQEPLIISRFNLLYGLNAKPYRLCGVMPKAGMGTQALKPRAAKAPPIKVLETTRHAINAMEDAQLKKQLTALADALETP